jgi:hypothetical protein
MTKKEWDDKLEQEEINERFERNQYENLKAKYGK